MQHRRKNNDNKKSHRTIRCHIYIQCYNNTNYNSSNKKLDKFNNVFITIEQPKLIRNIRV